MIGFLPGHSSPIVKHVKPPLVRVEMKALADMAALVDIVDSEVGWLGTVEVTENMDFIIHEIFLPKQNVHMATTEIDPEGFTELANELIAQRPDGVKIANSIRFWGHSHVNMGLSPSGQDEDQLRNLVQDAEDYFIAARANKHGGMRFDIQYASGIQIDDLPWEPYLQDDGAIDTWRAQVEAKVKPFIEAWEPGAVGTWGPGMASTWGDNPFGGDEDMYDHDLSAPDHSRMPTHQVPEQSGVGKPKARIAKSLPPWRKKGRKPRDLPRLTGDDLRSINELDWAPEVDPSDLARGITLAIAHHRLERAHYRPQSLEEGASTFIDWAGRTRPLREITDVEMEAAGFVVEDSERG